MVPGRKVRSGDNNGLYAEKIMSGETHISTTQPMDRGARERLQRALAGIED